MKLSIIIPIYNVESYIANCIESILDQKLNPDGYEIILINDGSTDSSVSIAADYCRRFKNIHLYHQDNNGVGAARNKGLTHAKGNFILFLDSDDYLTSDTLNPLLQIATEMNIDILEFDYQKTKSLSSFKSSCKYIDHRNLDVINGLDYIAQRNYNTNIWAYLLKRQFILKHNLRFIEGKWMEDVIFTTTMLVASERVVFIPMDVHRYFQRPKSAMKNSEYSHMVKVVYDMKNAVGVLNGIIENVIESSPEHNSLKRLCARQEALVFFLLARAIKSSMPIKEISVILQDLKSIGAYPITHFPGEDHKNTRFKLFRLLFNNQTLFSLLHRIFYFKNNLT